VALITASVRSRATQRRDATAMESQPLLSADVEPDRAVVKTKMSPYVAYPLLTVVIAAVGIASWYIQRSLGQGEQRAGGPMPKLEWKSQVLGYISAALYLGSRVPQIAHN